MKIRSVSKSQNLTAFGRVISREWKDIKDYNFPSALTEEYIIARLSMRKDIEFQDDIIVEPEKVKAEKKVKE